MTPKLRSKARAIAAEVNATGKSACVWILDAGADLGHGPDFPPRIALAKRVGCYHAPCSHGDMAEDVEHVLDELAAFSPTRAGRPRVKKA